MNARTPALLAPLGASILSIAVACSSGSSKPTGTNVTGCNPDLLPPGSCGPCCGFGSCKDCCDSNAQCEPEYPAAQPPPDCAASGYTDTPCQPGQIETAFACCTTCADQTGIPTAFFPNATWCPSGSCAVEMGDNTGAVCCVLGLQVPDADVPTSACTSPVHDVSLVNGVWTSTPGSGWACVGGCALDSVPASGHLCCPQGVFPDLSANGGDASADASTETDIDASADTMLDAGNRG